MDTDNTAMSLSILYLAVYKGIGWFRPGPSRYTIVFKFGKGDSPWLHESRIHLSVTQSIPWIMGIIGCVIETTTVAKFQVCGKRRNTSENAKLDFKKNNSNQLFSQLKHTRWKAISIMSIEKAMNQRINPWFLQGLSLRDNINSTANQSSIQPSPANQINSKT